MTEFSFPTEQDTDYLKLESDPEFFRPDYERGLNCILPTLFALLGKPVPDRPTLLPFLSPATPRRATRVFLLCIDSFGFKELARSSRFKALYRDYGTWITSVFPTITSAALTSIYQGLPPSRHGILGHLIWKNFPGAIVDMLRMQVVGAQMPLSASGFDPSRWQREPGLLEDGQVSGHNLLPEEITGSGLSSYLYGKTALVGYKNILHGFTQAGRMMRDTPEGWFGLYTPVVDNLSHLVGGDSPQVGLAVRHIEEGLHWMMTDLGPDIVSDTVFMVVADHGQVAIRERFALEGEPMQWLEAHTRAIGFSGRVMHVYLDGKPAGPVADWLAKLIGGQGRVFAFDEIKALTGPTSDDEWVRESLGDLVVLLRDGWNWQTQDPKPGRSPYAASLISQHGSLTWHEMFVPFLCAPLAAIGMD